MRNILLIVEVILEVIPLTDFVFAMAAIGFVGVEVDLPEESVLTNLSISIS